LSGGRKKIVHMMHAVRKFQYMEVPKFQAVILPYRLDASMYIFLPAKDSSLSELEQALTGSNWQEWLSQFDKRDGVLGLPKFKIEAHFDALTQLQALGVKRVFHNLRLFDQL
jgi:serine protease inhibitor